MLGHIVEESPGSGLSLQRGGSPHDIHGLAMVAASQKGGNNYRFISYHGVDATRTREWMAGAFHLLCVTPWPGKIDYPLPSASAYNSLYPTDLHKKILPASSAKTVHSSIINIGSRYQANEEAWLLWLAGWHYVWSLVQAHRLLYVQCFALWRVFVSVFSNFARDKRERERERGRFQSSICPSCCRGTYW